MIQEFQKESQASIEIELNLIDRRYRSFFLEENASGKNNQPQHLSDFRNQMSSLGICSVYFYSNFSDFFLKVESSKNNYNNNLILAVDDGKNCEEAFFQQQIEEIKLSSNLFIGQSCCICFFPSDKKDATVIQYQPYKGFEDYFIYRYCPRKDHSAVRFCKLKPFISIVGVVFLWKCVFRK